MPRVILGIMLSLLMSSSFSFDYSNLIKQAESGDSEAQYNLGMYLIDPYQNNGNQKIDFKKANEWFMKSALQGNRKSQYQIAILISDGKGYEKPDNQEAAKWYIKSAENGYGKAQYILAQLYASGNGVNRDMEKYFNWLIKASENDVSFAQIDLSNVYGSQNGEHYDPKMQYVWVYVAAHRNDMWNLKSDLLPQLKSGFTKEELIVAENIANQILKRLEKLNDPELLAEIEQRKLRDASIIKQ